MSSMIDQLYSMLETEIQGLGFELWGIEFLPGAHGLLRIYIESPNGIQIEDCEQVSRQVSAVLDVKDVIPTGYTLEVSSPGLDRLLFQAKQFPAYCGKKLNLQFLTPMHERRKCKAQLLSVTEGFIQIEHEGEQWLVPFDNIAKARGIPEF
mgnify:CR=1 FL=1